MKLYMRLWRNCHCLWVWMSKSQWPLHPSIVFLQLHAHNDKERKHLHCSSHFSTQFCWEHIGLSFPQGCWPRKNMALVINIYIYIFRSLIEALLALRKKIENTDLDQACSWGLCCFKNIFNPPPPIQQIYTYNCRYNAINLFKYTVLASQQIVLVFITFDYITCVRVIRWEQRKELFFSICSI